MTPAEPNAGEAPARNAAFATTHWSVVLAAGADNPARARDALEQLCTVYWYPLYAFLRRRGHQPADAEDLVQGFIAHLLERRWALTLLDTVLQRLETELPPIFAAELDGLQRLAVQNLRLRLKRLDFCELYAQLGEYPGVSLPDGRAEFALGDLVTLRLLEEALASLWTYAGDQQNLAEVLRALDALKQQIAEGWSSRSSNEALLSSSRHLRISSRFGRESRATPPSNPNPHPDPTQGPPPPPAPSSTPPPLPPNGPSNPPMA